MTATVKLYAAIIGLILLALSFSAWTLHERAIGARDAKLTQLEAAAHALSVSLDSTRAAFTVDTVRVVKRLTRTDTVLRHLIDTAIVQRTDTVKVPVTVLVQADSAIRSCSVTLSACGRLANLERARADTLAVQVKLLQGARPSIFARCGLSAGVGGVLAGGRVYGGPTVTAGCRVWP